MAWFGCCTDRSEKGFTACRASVVAEPLLEVAPLFIVDTVYGTAEMRLLPLFLIATLPSFAHTASASRPDYTYLGLGYAYERVDGGCRHDGLSLEGSLVLDELWFMQLQHTDVTSSSWCGSTTSSVAGGVRSNVGGSSSVYATGALLYRDYGFHSDFGIDTRAGVRSIVSPGFEASAFVGYKSVGGFETTFLGGGVNYWLSREMSVTTDLVFNDKNEKGINVGLRYTF